MTQIPGDELKLGMTMGPNDYILSYPTGLYQLTLQQNGNLTLIATTNTVPPPVPAWQSNTNCANPTCKMSPSGDLQIYDGATLISHSGTNASRASLLVLDTGQVQIVIGDEPNPAQITPPWCNGQMYPVNHSSASPALLDEINGSIRKMALQLLQLQAFVAELGAALHLDDTAVHRSGQASESHNGKTALAAGPSAE